MKALDFLSVHARFGPYITMAGKMVMNMSSIVVMLFYLSKLLIKVCMQVMLWISLLAFGLARQSITYPEEEVRFLLLFINLKTISVALASTSKCFLQAIFYALWGGLCR